MLSLDQINSIQKIISEIEEKSADGRYIYRGESTPVSQTTSRLYRDCQTRMLEDDINVQEEETNIWNEYNLNYVGMHNRSTSDDILFNNSQHHNDRLKIKTLTEMQHFGGNTNLIDFTEDYLIAMFFACNVLTMDGQVVLVKITEEDPSNEYSRMITCQDGNDVIYPVAELGRISAQKSVFVHALKTNGSITNDGTISIPSNEKQILLEYLKKYHGISDTAIYGDIHGFIQYISRQDKGTDLKQALHDFQDAEYEVKITLANSAVPAILPLTLDCGYVDVIKVLQNENLIAEITAVKTPGVKGKIVIGT